MKPLRTVKIIPSLPEKLKSLKRIAYNLWWTWNHEAIELFRRLDRELWEETEHNPIKLLGQIRQERLEQRAEDDSYLAQLQRVTQKLEDYLNEPTWYQKVYGDNNEIKIAYFSAEFGLTECIPNYSGGLGVLAGDHLKSSSELGLPMVGVGLLYQEGYFRQYLNADGWQGELYPQNDFYNMPIQLQNKEDGSPLLIKVEFPDRQVYAQVWMVRVGRINLYLLDTNIAMNNQQDRDITDELYGGDEEMRIQQEIVLGIGGISALKASGLNPTVYQMNEGHSAFLALERVRYFIQDYKLSFDEAKELAKASNVFTTHTPVPAGIDHFSPRLMDKYFSSYYSQLKISREKFLALGRKNPQDNNEDFSMAILAINLASYINGVSKLHGETSRKMWSHLWPNIPENEIPITSITNGIHPSSWISKEMATLYDRYLGPTWLGKPADLTIWERIKNIPGEELWRSHERRRERLVAFARLRLRKQLERQGALPSDIAMADEVLNPEALTIGFARRFATYKRANLLFHDPERLAQILFNKEYPVQVIIAGKAHPKDTPGKELIKKIIHLAHRDDLRQHIVFLEDYDMVIARYLVQGVDLWLNTPRRFMEASGTSGMKAAVNGVLNMSILDGWWDEAYTPDIGWSIGSGEYYENFEYQDEVESQAIYNLLEKEVIPLFYNRGQSNIPRKWIELMENSMAQICPKFNTNRMIRDYTDRFYLPAQQKYQILFKNKQRETKALVAWKSKIFKNWHKARFINIEGDGSNEKQVGSEMTIQSKIDLGDLLPEDVSVEIYHGYINHEDKIMDGTIDRMSCIENNGNNIYTFKGTISCRHSGLYGYTVRIIPQNENLAHPHETGLILWANL